MRHKIVACYDREADVLYVVDGEPRAAYSDEGDDGIDYRFDEANDAPCGATIDGFREFWVNREMELAVRVANFLNVDPIQVRSAVASITAGRSTGSFSR